MVGLGVAAWVLASTTDTDDNDGRVGDVATPGRTGKTPELQPKIERYVALGDSMTSAPYLPEIDTAGGCNRSSQNYPSLIADELNIADFVDVSCGGATTEDLRSNQFERVPPQLNAVTGDTELVTLTMGGNDLDLFAKFIIGCRTVAAQDPTGTPCQDVATEDGPDQLIDAIDAIGPRLESVLDAIHEQAPDAAVILLGYPRFFPSAGTCQEILPFATGDYPYLVSLMERLNDAQHAAAEATDTEFVDMYAASEGHDACSDDPWLNGAQVIHDGAAPFHPFPAGEAAMANAVLELLS